jgi:tRNA U34 5-methylaminomethyl-2-thiouridine-forming methyltransferase MnmC
LYAFFCVFEKKVVFLHKIIFMQKIQITEDGSHTLFSEMAGQTYHSSHGAVQESRHIFTSQLSTLNFISKGSKTFGSQLSILEIGFGTGLNVLLTAQWARENGVKVDFTTIELYPLAEEVYSELNYGQLLGDDELFLRLHEAEWDAGFVEVTENFAIRKFKSDIVEWLRNAQCIMHNTQLFDIVYFDAFSPDAQPELWTEEVFRNIYALMKEGGVMTTYCAKGNVRRAMLAAGFRVEKLQGPPGKRHILRALKE